MSQKSSFHRRIPIAISLLVVISLFLVSCGAPASQVPAPTEIVSQPTSVQPVATNTTKVEPVTLTLWDYTNPGPTEPWWQTFITNYQDAHPGVTIQRTPYAEKDYDSALRTAIAAGQVPDIMFVISGTNLHDYAQAGTIIPLDSLVDKGIWTPGLLESLQYDSKLYAVPQSPFPTPFWYNIKLFAANNVTPPKTWDDLLSLCDTFKSKNIIPISLGGVERWQASMFFQDLVNQTGGPDLIDKASTGKASYSDPAFIKAENYLLQLSDRGCFPKDFIGLDGNAMNQAFTNGDAAMEIMGPWLVGIARGTAAPDFEMGAFLFPKLPDALPGTETNMEGGIDAFAISAKCKNPEVAAAFLDAFGKADQSYVDAINYLPTIPGVTVKDPALQQVIDLMAGAKVMYVWGDRRIPSAIVDDYLNNLTSLITKQITPEQFGKLMDKAVADKVK